MEKIKNYYINLNFEDELYGNVTKPHILAFLEEFDFIFFLLNKEKCFFITKKKFSKEYLEKLGSLGFNVCLTKNDADTVLPWWGDFQNLELKKKFNSKSWFIKTLRELKICTNQSVMNRNSSEFEDFIKDIQEKFIIKSPYAMSGQKSYIVSKNLNFREHFLENETEVIISPYIDKIVEFSLIATSFDNIEINVSHYSSQGTFTGGLCFSNEEALVEYLISLRSSSTFQIWNKVISRIKNDIHKILDRMGQETSEPLSYPFALDALVYDEEENLKIEYLELNYRKTMGLLLISLKKLMKSSSIGKLSVTKKIRDMKGELELSPPGNSTKFYFDPNWPGA